MQSREIVRRAIEFEAPPRLPFFLGGSWSDKLSAVIQGLPNDVCDCWEMDRAKRGWFFDHVAQDDWGCGWAVTDVKTMGQVVHHPIEDWDKLPTYRPPNPRDPFYFERLEDEMSDAGDRYVVVLDVDATARAGRALLALRSGHLRDRHEGLVRRGAKGRSAVAFFGELQRNEIAGCQLDGEGSSYIVVDIGLGSVYRGVVETGALVPRRLYDRRVVDPHSGLHVGRSR